MIVTLLSQVLYFALLLFFLAMWARFLLDLARNVARQWRPRGALLIVAEAVFTVTDPPIRAVRKVIPPLRIGGLALDFAWSIVMFVVLILMSVVRSLPALV